MSRPIKFRGQREDNKEWVYGSLIEDKYIVGNVIDWNEDYFNTEYWWRVIPETVGQFTGLFDKIGKEIYEGDILHFGDLTIIYCVIWNDCGFKAYQVGSNRVEYTPSNSITMYRIGNIHDNGQTLHTCNEKPCYYVTID